MAPITDLSPRETTMLQLAAWGYTNSEIAIHLRLSVKTVEAHKFNGMRKLKLTSRAAVVRYAVEVGWLSPNAAPPLPAGSNTVFSSAMGSVNASRD